MWPSSATGIITLVLYSRENKANSTHLFCRKSAFILSLLDFSFEYFARLCVCVCVCVCVCIKRKFAFLLLYLQDVYHLKNAFCFIFSIGPMTLFVTDIYVYSTRKYNSWIDKHHNDCLCFVIVVSPCFVLSSEAAHNPLKKSSCMFFGFLHIWAFHIEDKWGTQTNFFTIGANIYWCSRRHTRNQANGNFCKQIWIT